MVFRNMVRCKAEHKKHRAAAKRFQNRCIEKADPTERSWRGVLRGHVPSKSLSADSEIPCAMLWRTGKVGEKSDSFSRAERTRPLRPVSRLLYRNFGNVPVERFQRDIALPKSADTARRVPTSCTMLFVTAPYPHKTKAPTASSYRRGFFICSF